MRPAAMPAFSATSGVSLAVLVRPLMPSVPKYLRVMRDILANCYCGFTTNWLPQVNRTSAGLIRLSYMFQNLKAVFPPLRVAPKGGGAVAGPGRGAPQNKIARCARDTGE